MAASRLERIGTIYSRVQGLLRSGAMKPDDKPLWYEVYEAFTPKYEPHYGRVTPQSPVRNILYPEDEIRAIFYKKFNSPGTINLRNPKSTSPCELFVAKYKELESSYTDQEELIAAAFNAANNMTSSASSHSSSFSTMYKEAISSPDP